jgi:hypothetical protein
MPQTIDRSGRFTRAGNGAPGRDIDTTQPQAVVTLTRPVKIAAALFGVMMLALLGGQFVFIIQQRAINAEQRNIARIQRDRARPVLQDSRVLLQNAREAFGPLQQGAARADMLIRGLSRADAPKAIAATGDLAADLAQRQRLVQMVDGINALLRDLSRRGTTADVDRVTRDAHRTKRIAGDLLDLQRRAYATNRQSLATQRRSEAMFRESLAIQRELLTHARSLDNKTGGPAPGSAP